MSSPDLRIQPIAGQPSIQPISSISQPAENEITQIFLKAILECKAPNESAFWIEKASSLACRLAQIAVANHISKRVVSILLDKSYLKLKTFIENDALVEVFAQVMRKSLDRYDKRYPKRSKLHRRSTLSKIISAAFDNKSIAHKGTFKRIDDRKYLMRLKVKKAELYSVDMKTLTLIAKGKYLSVFRAYDPTRQSNLVLKAPNVLDRQHINKMLYEKRAIKEIHQSLLQKQLPTDPIKSIPYAFFGTVCRPKRDPNAEIKNYNGAFLIEEEYDETLYDLVVRWSDGCDPTLIGIRLKTCRMLLRGLAAIHETGYAHGDITLSNVLTKGLDQDLIAHIADFGDVVNQQKIIDEQKLFREKPIGVFSRYYALMSDLNREEQAGKIKDVNHASELAIRYKQQRDVFAMGMLIAFILSGNNPFACTSLDEFNTTDDESPDIKRPRFETAMKRIVPEDKFEPLKDLIWGMVNGDPDLRFTAPQALAAFDKIGSI